MTLGDKLRELATFVDCVVSENLQLRAELVHVTAERDAMIAKAREIADVNHLSSNIKKGPMEAAKEILSAGEAAKKERE